MQDAESAETFLGTPLRHPEADEFNRAGFSRSLATRLATMGSAQGAAVVGLYGEWGSGKSTVLNFGEVCT